MIEWGQASEYTNKNSHDLIIVKEVYQCVLLCTIEATTIQFEHLETQTRSCSLSKECISYGLSRLVNDCGI